MERHAAHTPRTRRASACAAGAPALRERLRNFSHFFVLGLHGFNLQNYVNEALLFFFF